VVFHGLEGIDKTWLTIAYAKRHKDDYSAVFWLNVKGEDSLKQSFAKAARQVLREHPSASPLSTVDIKENLDKVIGAITTRSSQVKIGHPIQIGKLEDVRDSENFIKHIETRRAPLSRVMSDRQLNTMLDPNVVELAVELDGLPSTLATAGAYLDQTIRLPSPIQGVTGEPPEDES